MSSQAANTPLGPAPSGPCTTVYRPRHPERTVLYQVVQHHLESWLAERDAVDDPAPWYVEVDFRRYLDCGLLCRGFARARCPACGHDFLLAFSCAGRGICPSCAARHMAETAAHLVDHVLPQVPVRQWVVALPKRLRYFVHRDAELAGRVLNVWLRALESRLRQCSPGAPASARIGAVSFIQRFGSTINPHLHYHCAVIDGVFSEYDGALRFHQASALDDADIAELEGVVAKRVLRLFERRGLLSREAAHEMASWGHNSGFSVDASVRIEANDRAGLERLLRYCARPVFASERLTWHREDEQLAYQLPKPRVDGQSVLVLTPFELLDRLAVLVPPPRRHRHRYHGVLAPNARLRALVTAYAGQPLPDAYERPRPRRAHHRVTTADEPTSRSPASYLWAVLLARIYDCFPLLCPRCGTEMRLVAFLTEPPSVEPILAHLGLPTEPPQVAPARGPPHHDADMDQTPLFDTTAPDPDPGFEFDQRVSW